MKLNKKFSLALIATSTLLLISNSTYAFKQEFGGTAGYDWAKVSPRNTKTDSETYAAITWLESDHTDHKMWFRIVNSDGEDRGNILITRPSETPNNFDTKAKEGYYYWLEAGREHIHNPITYVSGRWEP